MKQVEAAREAAHNLARAVESIEYSGWDPFDALASPLLRTAAPTRFLRRLAIQGVKRFPLNLRPFLLIPRLQHTKGIALFASAYACMAAGDRNSPEAAKARMLAQRLRARGLRVPSGIGWGYDFFVELRWGRYGRGDPNAVVTSFAAHALLDVAALEGTSGDNLVDQAVSYALDDLLVETGPERYFAYFAGSKRAIHNASMLVASFCLRSGVSEARRAAEDAITYSVHRQRPDGTWPYGGSGSGMGRRLSYGICPWCACAPCP